MKELGAVNGKFDERINPTNRSGDVIMNEEKIEGMDLQGVIVFY
jgi:hypothetical protein